MSLPPDLTHHQQVVASEANMAMQAQYENFNKKGPKGLNAAPAPEPEINFDG